MKIYFTKTGLGAATVSWGASMAHNIKRNTANYRVDKRTTPTDGNDVDLGRLQVDPTGRSRQVRWTDDMDGFMITALVEHVLAGHKRSDNGFTAFQVSKAIERVVNGSGVVVSEKNVRARLKTLKKEHAEVHQLLSMSGFGLDPDSGRVLADPVAWEEFITGKPEFVKWKNKLCPRYEDMETIFGNNTATGDRAISGFDSFSPMNVADESVNEIEQESMDTDPSPVHCRKRSAEEIRTKIKRRRKLPADESTIALLRIADSSTKIANAMEMQANIDTLNHVNWQLIVEKLENMNLDMADVMQVMKSFRSDDGLAKVFMNLTSMKYMRALVFELLGREPPPLP